LSVILSNKMIDNLTSEPYNQYMITSQTINIRTILRNHKKIFDQVKNRKNRLTVVSQDEPQVGIISIDDLKKLEAYEEQERNQQSTKSLLEVADKVQELLKNETLPKDLSLRHDDYHYTD